MLGIPALITSVSSMGTFSDTLEQQAHLFCKQCTSLSCGDHWRYPKFHSVCNDLQTKNYNAVFRSGILKRTPVFIIFNKTVLT